MINSQFYVLKWKSPNILPLSTVYTLPLLFDNTLSLLFSLLLTNTLSLLFAYLFTLISKQLLLEKIILNPLKTLKLFKTFHFLLLFIFHILLLFIFHIILIFISCLRFYSPIFCLKSYSFIFCF